MKKLAMVVGGLVMSLPLLGYAQDDVIASAGQASVTQTDVAALVRSLDAPSRSRLAADPAALDQVVRMTLAEKAALAEAKAKGWDRQPQVQAAIDQAQRGVLVRSYLASVSEPAADYPSDAEIQGAYERNQAAFTAPRALHLAQIYIATAPDADAATLAKARSRAADLATQAHARGADFAALARANSQDTASAANGGDMGFVAETVLLPAIRQATDALKPGQVSAAVETPAGFHVVKLIDTRAAGLRPLADVKEQIRAALRQQRAQQNAQAYLAKLVAPAAVPINEEALKRALAAAQ